MEASKCNFQLLFFGANKKSAVMTPVICLLFLTSQNAVFVDKHRKFENKWRVGRLLFQQPHSQVSLYFLPLVKEG